jgi:hypothetical protein
MSTRRGIYSNISEVEYGKGLEEPASIIEILAF